MAGMKNYTITAISRANGRRHTWHTDKFPDFDKLTGDYGWVNIKHNTPIVARGFLRAGFRSWVLCG